MTGPEQLAPAPFVSYDPSMWIVLVGFNASGKSSLARRLALLTDRRALDLDQAVEERAGQTLSEIFQDGGPDPAARTRR